MSAMWRMRQWLGWPSGGLVAAVHLDARAATLVAMRDRPLRVVASGATSLEPGDVRDDGIRLVGAVAQRVDQLREDLQLPRGTALVGVQSGIARSGQPDQIGDDAVVRRSDRVSLEQAAQAAGFRPLGVVTSQTLALRVPALPRVRTPRRLRSSVTDVMIAAGLDALTGSLTHPGEVAAPTLGNWNLETIGSPAWS